MTPSSKVSYYDLLISNGVDDILKNVSSAPYSLKYRTIKELLQSYPVSQVNKALYYYDTHYIKKSRINIFAMNNILKGLCDKC